MALITTNELLAKAIDTNNAKLAGQVADKLRLSGCNYADIFRLVQAVRPEVTAADWEALMYAVREWGYALCANEGGQRCHVRRSSAQPTTTTPTSPT